jgi:glycosyltransferase involved in cell wall biosynthesis
MKILVLNDYFASTAGGFVVAYNLAMECRRRGHEIAFITTVQHQADQGMTEHEGTPVYKIYTKYPLRFRGLFTIWNPAAFRPFRNIVQEIRPDIIHAHVIHIYLSHYVLKIASRLGIPVVLTAHDAMTFCYTRLRESCSPHGTARHKANMWECLRCQRFRYVPFRNACLRHYINTYTSAVISVCDALKEGLEINGIQRVQTIYNGINPREFEVSESQIAQFRKDYNLEGKRVLVFAGRANSSKGIKYLVKAMPDVLKAHPDARLLILSSLNTHTAALRARAHELGISSALIFPGWIDRETMKSAYAAADICVVPSTRFEPLATVVLEAMASKKPVIGTAVGGTAEMIVDGQTGYVVPPRDSQALSDKIVYLLQHPEVAQRLGEAGSKRVQEQFLITRQCDHVLQVYNEAIRRKQPPHPGHSTQK